MVKQISSETLMIIIVSLSIALAVNTLRPGGIAVFGTVQKTAAEAEHAGFKEISVEAGIEKFKSGTVLFVDARSPEDFAAEHIQGAVNLPEQEFDARIDKFIAEIPPEKEIIAYCDGEHCALGKDLAEKLSLVGFEKVFYITNGFSRWKENSQPVESGEL
ncbi:MAG: hypothetical protein BWK80_00310 [Desulfobacteraceae bacterium IS3]|nr:MAG: hypothetical protein BWK80_00310 [Desulfobacteraceae bacterium IS3]